MQYRSNVILSFINIRKVPREGFALGFQHCPPDLANVNKWKIMFGPSINRLKRTILTERMLPLDYTGMPMRDNNRLGNIPEYLTKNHCSTELSVIIRFKGISNIIHAHL